MRRSLDIDHSKNHLRIYQEDDVADVLDQNAELRSQPQKSDWGRHVASIPNIITLKWLNEERARGRDIKLFSEEFNELVEQKLRDPDYAYLRTDGPRQSLGWSK